MSEFGLAPLKIEGEYFYPMGRPDGAPIQPTEEDKKKRGDSELIIKIIEKECSSLTGILSPQEFSQMTRRILDTLEKHGGYFLQYHTCTDILMENLLIALGYGDAVEIIRSTHRIYA